ERLAGNAERARAWLGSAREIAVRLGNVIEQGRVAVAFAELAIGVGNFREAEAHAAEAVGLFEPIGNRTRLAGVRILQGQILALQDQAGPALVRVAEAAALVADDACPLFMAEVLAARAEVLDDSGAGDVARQALALAGELAAQCGADALVEDLRRCAE